MKKSLLIVALCIMHCALSTVYAGAPEALPGRISVSKTKQVQFSPGNLQCYPATDTWQFAATQMDTIGQSNLNVAPDYEGWLDHFSWSAEGHNFGVYKATDEREYAGGEFVDWGQKIGPEWFTLTLEEWQYVIQNRKDAHNLNAGGSVNGMNGIIILPDDWQLPEGLIFNAYGESATYSGLNTYTLEQWAEMERAGAVFLAEAGYRMGAYFFGSNDAGYYWTCTDGTSKVGANAYYFAFDEHQHEFFKDSARKYGYCVRLVKEASAVTGLENVSNNANVSKRMVNGQVYIVRDGKTYNVLGTEIE